MGRTRAKTKQPTLRHDTLAEKAQPSVDALLAKAQDLVVQCNYELALQFASRVLSRETNHADARELLGVCQLELGQIEDARKVRESVSFPCSVLPNSTRQTFQTLVPPHPNAPKPPPPSAYLYLAQLQDGDPREALRCYQSAIDILYAQLKGKDRLPPDAAGSVTDERSTKNAIVRALIGMVEIWMDPEYDLWCVLTQCS
jgi:tetratricopeptide (TPR) repeat protein